jgi:HAD superfamily hydrolase (TIGR01509 family)
VAAVTRTAARWPVGLASSSNRPVIDKVLEVAGIAACFRVTVSSEEVGAGKPAPDVYLAAAAALGFEPAQCVAVEDSSNGIRSAAAAGLKVVAVPNAAFRATDEALRLSAAVIANLDDLTPELIAQAAVAP